MRLISTNILWAMARTHSNRGPRTRALYIEGLERVKWSFFNIVLKSLQTTGDSLGCRVTDSVPESNNSVKIRGLKCWSYTKRILRLNELLCLVRPCVTRDKITEVGGWASQDSLYMKVRQRGFLVSIAWRSFVHAQSWLSNNVGLETKLGSQSRAATWRGRGIEFAWLTHPSATGKYASEVRAVS